MEIRPASLAQLMQGRDGKLIEIDDDVQGVANALHEIDPHIRLRFSEAGGYFVIYWKPEEGEEGDGYLIFTAQELDHRIIQHMREVHHRCLQPGYSLANELDKAEAKAKAAIEYERDEEFGEVAERLAHAMRSDLGHDQSRIYVPENVS